MKVEIDFNEDTADKFPVYCQYPGQYQNQPAYIKIDIRNGRVWPDYNGNIGGGCSPDEFHGLVQRFSIPGEIHRTDLSQLLKDNVNFFQKVVDSYEEKWNGSNYVARRREGVADDIGWDLVNEWECEIVSSILVFGIIDVMQEFLNAPPKKDIEKHIVEWFENDGEYGWFEQQNVDELAAYIASELLAEDCEGNPALAKWLLRERDVESLDGEEEYMKLKEIAKEI